MKRVGLTALMLLVVWVASAAGEVTVATDKAVYTVGEDITITIHNHGPADVDFCAWPLFAIKSQYELRSFLPVTSRTWGAIRALYR